MSGKRGREDLPPPGQEPKYRRVIPKPPEEQEIQPNEIRGPIPPYPAGLAMHLPAHQPVIRTPVQHPSLYRQVKFENALEFLDQVKLQFAKQPRVYNQFLDIMKDFKTHSIDTPGVIARVSELFKGHKHLIMGFNTFLPPGYKIDVDFEEGGQTYITTPQMPGMMHPIQSSMQSPLVSGPSTPMNVGVPTPLNPSPQMVPTLPPNLPASVTNNVVGGSVGLTATNQSGAMASRNKGGGAPPIPQSNAQFPAQKKQPEFDHARNYVKKIKMRFSSQPNIYKSFLEILHTYHKEQHTIKDVYDKVATLFQNHRDLLDEFTEFLPDTVSNSISPANMGANSQSMPPSSPPTPASNNQQGSSRVKPRGSKPSTISSPSALSIAASSKRLAVEGKGSDRLNNKRVPKKEDNMKKELSTGGMYKDNIGSAASSPSSLGEEKAISKASSKSSSVTTESMNLFNKIKHQLGNDKLWYDFVKCLNMFNQEIISRFELVILVRDLLARYPDQYEKFKQLIGYSEPTEPEPTKPKQTPWSEIDFSTCKRCGPSYRALPKNYKMPISSGRTSIQTEVLNDSWVSVPTGSEDFGFKNTRKNQYEEVLFKCEDERYDLDLAIELNASAMRALEPLLRKVQKITDLEEATQFKVDPAQLDVLHMRSVERIYGDKGREIVNALFTNPVVAIPIVHKRLRQKDQEWRKARREWNKIWREIHEKNYWKGLEQESVFYKKQEKKSFSQAVLMEEIKRKYQEKNREHKNLLPGQFHHLVFSLNDDEIVLDMLDTIRVTAAKILPDKGDTLKIENFLRVLFPFFGVKSESVEETTTLIPKSELTNGEEKPKEKENENEKEKDEKDQEKEKEKEKEQEKEKEKGDDAMETEEKESSTNSLAGTEAADDDPEKRGEKVKGRGKKIKKSKKKGKTEDHEGEEKDSEKLKEKDTNQKEAKEKDKEEIAVDAEDNDGEGADKEEALAENKAKRQKGKAKKAKKSKIPPQITSESTKEDHADADGDKGIKKEEKKNTEEDKTEPKQETKEGEAPVANVKQEKESEKPAGKESEEAKVDEKNTKEEKKDAKKEEKEKGSPELEKKEKDEKKARKSISPDSKRRKKSEDDGDEANEEEEEEEEDEEEGREEEGEDAEADDEDDDEDERDEDGEEDEEDNENEEEEEDDMEEDGYDEDDEEEEEEEEEEDDDEEYTFPKRAKPQRKQEKSHTGVNNETTATPQLGTAEPTTREALTNSETYAPMVVDSEEGINSNRKFNLFFANSSLYYLLRLCQILYDCLARAKSMANSSARDKFLRLSSTNGEGATTTGGGKKVDRYKVFVKSLHSLMSQNIDSAKYEDECRELFGYPSYVLFTLSDLLTILARQLSRVTADEESTKLMSLFKINSSSKSSSVALPPSLPPTAEGTNPANPGASSTPESSGADAQLPSSTTERVADATEKKTEASVPGTQMDVEARTSEVTPLPSPSQPEVTPATVPTDAEGSTPASSTLSTPTSEQEPTNAASEPPSNSTALEPVLGTSQSSSTATGALVMVPLSISLYQQAASAVVGTKKLFRFEYELEPVKGQFCIQLILSPSAKKSSAVRAPSTSAVSAAPQTSQNPNEPSSTQSGSPSASPSTSSPSLTSTPSTAPSNSEPLALPPATSFPSSSPTGTATTTPPATPSTATQTTSSPTSPSSSSSSLSSSSSSLVPLSTPSEGSVTNTPSEAATATPSSTEAVPANPLPDNISGEPQVEKVSTN